MSYEHSINCNVAHCLKCQNQQALIRQGKKLLENELYYRSKPIAVLTQIVSFWQMKAYS